MEVAWWHAHNARRMDSTRSGGICRRFINGSCSFGPRCNYRHNWPAIPSSQICRYFQKGGCWYGESCRYLHVLLPEVDAAIAGRRSSVPAVSSSSVAYATPGRRGSEPALLQAELMSRQECSRSEFVVNVPNPQRNIGRMAAADIAEEHTQDTDSHVTANWGLIQSSEVDQAGACASGNKQESTSNETTEDGATAAVAFITQVEETKAFLQSKNVTCSICMDKVYEKPDPRNHIFGILPNCNHSFCLQCIMTWRKTKDLGPDVVKTCPQCRVRSAFYVPNKYWVEGPEKETVIAAFQEKFSKRSCAHYSRYRCCPFKTECLYRHDKHARRRPLPYPAEDVDYYESHDLLDLIIAMTLLSGDEVDEDDDFDFQQVIFLTSTPSARGTNL